LSADIPPSPSPYSIHPSQKPLVQLKEPTISKIELSQSDLDKLKKVLRSPKMGPMAKDLHQRKIVGICGRGDIPEFILTRYYDSVQKIETLCTKCIQKERISKALYLLQARNKEKI
jgi:hypothetical protein